MTLRWEIKPIEKYFGGESSEIQLESCWAIKFISWAVWVYCLDSFIIFFNLFCKWFKCCKAWVGTHDHKGTKWYTPLFVVRYSVFFHAISCHPNSFFLPFERYKARFHISRRGISDYWVTWSIFTFFFYFSKRNVLWHHGCDELLQYRIHLNGAHTVKLMWALPTHISQNTH